FESRMLAAGARGLTDSERTNYLEGLRDSIRAETRKIEPPPRQTINFTARDGVVSLTIRNTTGYPVKVGLRLQGEKLELPGHEDGSKPLEKLGTPALHACEYGEAAPGAKPRRPPDSPCARARRAREMVSRHDLRCWSHGRSHRDRQLL